MTEFCFVTDTHLAANQPANRIDNYNESVLQKIEFVCKYCNDNSVSTLVHGGDLLHSHHVKPDVLIAFADLMIKYNLDLYYVYGNHDVQGANFDFIDKTNLGLISRYPWFHELNERIEHFDDCVLSGYNYTVNRKETYFPFPDTGHTFAGRKVLHTKKKILVLHANIYDVANENPMIEKIGVRNNEIETDADLVLCGHTHYGWEKGVKCDGTIIINPGSIARVKYDEHTNGFGPRLVHIKVDKEIEYQFVQIPVNPAFDETKYKVAKKVKERRSKFLDTFKELSYSNIDVAPELTEFIEHPPNEVKEYMTPIIKGLCFDYLHRARGDL